ncbi:hypothetical protein IU500_13565 [Nocardia terpenica]|uniref:toxin glutamine deamidase domain-containing protein n=1 Tax=Nocardia terpenica TaxID=455432 RepID=UPI001893D4CB|nr:toxin glutamine deamidase domain-containing protein [Nocardia terpenica]MBF6062794.1 hypothetical protein [Nocardia terpenica]MBF6105071.1 hypothetical protein [Nocardia terpenica]MBF6112492.1 hypothetical protein [Nocardia terpenica]MBF6118799.1 hypothetical protein [Nocardia terpenica]MBF6154268.1 hypothetical protein [Nocardia terpenica]
MTLWFPHLPGVGGWLEDFLIGHWPEGDEDAMRRAAGHWSNMATALRELQRPADQAMEAALSAIEGRTHDAMSSYWQEVAGGDGSELQRFIDTCDNFAKQLEHGATDIEYAKLSIYISVASMLAMAFIPVVGEAVDAAAAAAVKLFVRKTVQELIDKLALKGASFLAERVGLGVAEKLGTNAASSLVVNVGKQAVIGAGLGAGTDVAAQGIQVAEGHRDGIDGNSVWQSAASGAVAGAVAGPVSQGIEAAGSKVTGGLADRLGIEHEPGKLASYLTSGASAIPGNLAGNAAASVSSAALTGGPVDFGSIHDGAGGGFIAKPHQAPHPETSSHTDTAPAADTGGTHSPDAPASVRTEQSPTTSTTATRADTAVPADAPRPEVSTAPAAAAAPAVDGTRAATSTAGTGHTDSVTPSSNSTGVSHVTDNPANSHAAPAGGPAAVDRASAGQAPLAHTPDRAAVQAPESVPPKGTGPAPDRPMPALAGDRPVLPSTSRPLADIPQRPDLAARPDTPAPPSDRIVAPQRATDIPRPSRADVPDSATPSPRDTSGPPHRLDSVPHAPTDRGPVSPRSPEIPRTPTGAEVPDRHPAPGARDTNTTPHAPEATASLSTDRPSGGTDSRTQAPGPIIAGVPVASPHGLAARSPHETAGPPDSPRGRSDASQPNQKRPERDNGSPRKGQEQPRPRPDDHESEHHRPHESTAERELPTDSADHAVDRTRENAPSGSDPHSAAPGLERLPVPHEPGAEPLELSYGDQKIIGEYAAKRGVSFDDVVRGIQDGSLVLGRHYVFERPTLLETPEQLDPRYLTEVVAHKIDNPRNPRRYANMEPDAFEAGCPDSELPAHLSRSTSGDALASAVTPTDLTKMVVNYDGDGLSPVWRDHSAADAFLDARNALFRMDSRGPEIFGPGFAPRDPSNLSISAHVGDTGRGHADGFVSLSKSPERTIARERNIAAGDLDRLAAEGKLERLPDGTFRQIRYMHELYHAHGIDVDATFHDATAHRRYNEGTHYEAEVLAPGGISGDTIYRIWPREIIVDAHGNPVSVTVGEPIYNPRFAHLDNPRFTATHDVPAQAHSRSADEHVQHRSGWPDPVDNDRPPTEHALPPRPDNPPQHTESVHPDNRSQVRESLQAPESHPYQPWLYRAPESEPPRPQEEPWPSYTAPESAPPHAPTHESATPRHAQPRPAPAPMQQHRDPVSDHPQAEPYSPTQHTSEATSPQANRLAPQQPITPVWHQPRPNVVPAPHESVPPHQPVQSHQRQAVPPREQPPAPPPHERPHTPAPSREHRPEPEPSRPRRGDSVGSLHDPRHGRPHPADPRHAVRSPEMQQAIDARQRRESYRQQMPENGHVTEVAHGRGRNARPVYDVRRYPNAHGGPITVIRIRTHVAVDRHIPPHEVQRLWENTQLATDLAFNHGQRLLSGDRVLIDLVHTPDPNTAHLHINVSDDLRNPANWHPNTQPDLAAERLRHQLGLESGHGPGLNPAEIRQLSNDITHANTGAGIENPSELRKFGKNELQGVERAEYQAAVEDSLRDGDRFLVGADPRSNDYGQLINDGGIGVQGRSNNCLDCALSALASFLGRPQVSAPRWPDRLPDRTIDTHSGEASGLDRAAQWIGDGLHQDTSGRPIPEQFARLHELISNMGPGSSALVVNEWHAHDPRTGQPLFNADGTPRTAGSHATVIVYPHDATGPVWWDPQAGTTSDHPPAQLAHGSTGLWYTPIPADEGGAHGGIPHQGASGAVPGPNLQPRPPVPPLPVRDRLAGPADPHPGADHSGTGGRSDEPGDRLGDRSSHRVPELELDNDRGRPPRGETDRTPPDGAAGVSAPGAAEHPAHAGGLGDDRLRRPDPIPDRTAGGEHRVSPDHQQEHSHVPADSTHGGERGLLGGDAQQPGRDLAGRGDLGGVEAVSDHSDHNQSVVAHSAEPPAPGASGRGDAERYLNESRVTDALRRADERGVVTEAGGPIGEAVRSQLPEHPGLVQLMRDNPYLEHSLLEQPKALHSLLERPDSIPILSEAAHSVAERGPESILADPVHVEPTPLTTEQRMISQAVHDAVSDVDIMDQRQPGWDQTRRNDLVYGREFLDRQYAAWPGTQEALNNIARDIAGEANGEQKGRPIPKDRERAWAKILRKYKGDASRLTDLVGAKIEFDRVEDVYRALELIANDPRIDIVSFDDRFATPLPSGYRDLQLNIRMSNGHIAELRLHLSHIDDVAYYEHALYQVRRDFETLADRNHRAMGPEERALRIELQRRFSEIYWDATKKGLPDEFPPDTERGPDDSGPEPDGPVPRSGPNGPTPRPTPDSGGAAHDIPVEADNQHSTARDIELDAPDNSSGVRDRAEIGRQVNKALDESVARQIRHLEEEADVKRFLPGAAGRAVRNHLNSEIARLETGKRNLQEFVTQIATDPRFDPAIADAWYRDGMKLAVRIPDEDGLPTTMMFIDRGPTEDPLLVPLRSLEHAVAVVAREARNDMDPAKLHAELGFMTGRPDEAQGHIAADDPEHALELGVRIVEDSSRVEEVRGQLFVDLARSTARHLDAVPERVRDRFSEQGIKPRRNELREYEQKLADDIRDDAAQLRNTIEQLTEPGLAPRIYDAWRQAESGVTIQLKSDDHRGNYNERLPRVRLLDMGSGHEPLLVPVDAREHRLAHIGQQLSAGRHPSIILDSLSEPNREVVTLTAEDREQAMALGREALLDKQIAEELDSAAAAGVLPPEVDAIRRHLGSELDRAADRWLDPGRSTPGTLAARINEREVQSAILHLRSRINESVRIGIDPEMYVAWGRDAPAVGFRIERADVTEQVTVLDLGSERGKRLVPTHSEERELALIDRELRDGTYPPDIVRKLEALSEHSHDETVTDYDAALEEGEPLLPQMAAIRRQVQSSLERSVSETAQFEWKGNFEPTEEQLHAARLDHARSVEAIAQDLRGRVRDHTRAGIDPETYTAWREAHDSVTVTVGHGDHTEHLTMLDLGPDKEPRLVRSRSPEWELYRIERMHETGESIHAVHRDLAAGTQDGHLRAETPEDAIELGREVVRQKKEAYGEIDAMERRSLDAAQRAAAAGEFSPAEFARREQQIRADTRAIREIADRLFRQGIDPRVVARVREMYDGDAAGTLTHRVAIAGPPDVILTIEPESAGGGPQHDHTAGPDHEQQSRTHELESTRVRELAEKREHELVQQQELARKREREIDEQRTRDAAHEREREQEREHERQQARERQAARQEELERTRALRKKYERELARATDAAATRSREHEKTVHATSRGPERADVREPEHAPVNEFERPQVHEPEQSTTRGPERSPATELAHLPVREPEGDKTRGVDRDGIGTLERDIARLVEQERQLMQRHEHEVAREQELDLLREREREQFMERESARERELAPLRQSILERELEILQTRNAARQFGEELRQIREPSNEVRTPVLDIEQEQVREPERLPAPEPVTIEWRSAERQLGQLLSMVKRAEAPSPAIKVVITATDVREAMARELDCPQEYWQHLVNSPEYQQWLALQREQQEQALAKTRARGLDEKARGTVRTR